MMLEQEAIVGAQSSHKWRGSWYTVVKVTIDYLNSKLFLGEQYTVLDFSLSKTNTRVRKEFLYV